MASFGRILLLLAVAALLLLSLLVGVANGAGKGCIGLWQASEDVVFVTDSDAVALHVVSLSRGESLERFLFLENSNLIPRNEPERKVANAIGIASCRRCDFAIYTSFRDFVYRINFPDTVERLLRQNRSFVEGATVDRLFFAPKQGQDNFTMANPRMVLLQEEGAKAGTEGWMTEQKTDHAGLYKFHLSRFDTTVFTRLVFAMPFKHPYGVTVSARQPSELLVPFRDGRVAAVHRHTGRTFEAFDLAEACPRMDTSRDKFIGRQVYDDPTADPQGHRGLLLQGFTHLPLWDAAVWRYNHTSGACHFLAGRTGRTSGWVDGVGRHAQFTRVHFMILLRHTPRLVLSDIDNRALRIVDIASSFTYTVMYDRDRRLQQVQQLANIEGPAQVVGSNYSLQNPPPFSLYSADLHCQGVQENRRRVGANKRKPLVQVQVTSALDDRTPVLVVLPTTKQVIWKHAESYCHDVGWRLCEATELKRAHVALEKANDTTTNVLKNQTTWTKSECASCWKRFSPNWCEPPPLTSIKTLDLLEGQVHTRVREFRHVWNNGSAYEVGPEVAPIAVDHSITVCPGLTVGGPNKPRLPRAKIACCVDCLQNNGNIFD